MPGTTREWPAWPEYTNPSVEETRDSDFLSVKKTIIDKYGPDILRQSWIKVCRDLQAVTNEIADKGNSIIPIFETARVLEKGFTDIERAEIQRVGTFICKATIPKTEVNVVYDDMTKFINDNKTSIQAWPKESPSMYVLYNSPSQNAVRSHPNHIGLQRRLNQLWHNYDEFKDTSPEPLVYLDGVRDRAPGQPFLGLGPHIDAGSLCRWADPAYRKVYDEIFRGRPETHDAYNLDLRKDANQDLYKGSAHSTVLRTFQGWTALTPTEAREGTIMVYPNVKSAIAYIMLRPFFRPPENNDADVLDPDLWTLDESGWFPGTSKPQSQRLSRASHPHLRLEECLLHIPKVNPGDTVWWHCDLCHAVDTDHLGKTNAAVAFIAACPTTAVNKDYVKRQLLATLEGRPPPDYTEGNDNALDETKLKGYKGLDGLSTEARKAFGFELI